MDVDDLTLMQRVAKGDENAIRMLYDRFGTLVFRNACQVLGTVAEAEDATQEVFVKVWSTADRFDPSRAKLITWVLLISRRMFIDRLRRRIVRPQPASLDETTHDTGVESKVPMAMQEGTAAVRKRLGELPELQRVVIERVYLGGFTLREVAEQLALPVGTVKSALSRGLARLRDRFGVDRAG
jgi:RNA polymerase sigma-70 factor (ECF subfamily)